MHRLLHPGRRAGRGAGTLRLPDCGPGRWPRRISCRGRAGGHLPRWAGPRAGGRGAGGGGGASGPGRRLRSRTFSLRGCSERRAGEVSARCPGRRGAVGGSLSCSPRPGAAPLPPCAIGSGGQQPPQVGRRLRPLGPSHVRPAAEPGAGSPLRAPSVLGDARPSHCPVGESRAPPRGRDWGERDRGQRTAGPLRPRAPPTGPPRGLVPRPRSLACGRQGGREPRASASSRGPAASPHLGQKEALTGKLTFSCSFP